MRRLVRATLILLAASLLHANPIPQFEFDLANGEEDFRLTGEPGEQLGYALAAGRLRSPTGYHDLVVGVPGAAAGIGAVRVYFGGWTLDPGAPDFWITGDPALPGARLGHSLACGDVNGDGLDDLVIGCPRTTDGGRVYVIYGAASLAGPVDLGTTDPGCLITGRTITGRLGETLEVADLNGDGRDDLLMSDPLGDPLGRENAGAVYVVFGRADLPPEIHLATDPPDFVVFGAQPGDSIAADMSVGDLDGDRRADLALGVPTQGVGRVHVLRGRATVKDTVDLLDQTDVLFEGELFLDRAGTAVHFVDVDNDTISDILIGVPSYEPQSSWAALFYGHGDFPSHVRISGNAADARIFSGDQIDWVGQRIASGHGLWPLGEEPNVVVSGFRSDHDSRPEAGTTTLIMDHALDGDVDLDWDYAARIYGGNRFDHAGEVLLVADIFDLPERDDLFIGAPDAAEGAGEVYALHNLEWVGIGDTPGQPPGIPTGSLLAPNRPNPFNPSTTIEYRVPGDSRLPVDVRLEVFTMRGRRVRILASGAMPPGAHRVVWDGTDDQGRPVGSGVYIYRVRAGQETASRKMLLAR